MTNAEQADATLSIIITAHQDAEAIPFLAQEIAASHTEFGGGGANGRSW